MNLNCVEDIILFCFIHISKLFTWISVEKVRKLKNVSYTTSSKGDSYKRYYETSNRINRSSMCTHLATEAGTSWLCLGLQHNPREGQPSAAKGWWIRRKAGKSSTETHEQQEDKTYSKWDHWHKLITTQISYSHVILVLNEMLALTISWIFSAYCFIETGFFSLFNTMKVFGLKIDFPLTTLSCLTNSLHSRLMTFTNSFAMCSVIHRMNKDLKKQS